MGNSPEPSTPRQGGSLKRILIKLSGEALMGQEDYGIDPLMIKRIAAEIREVHDLGLQVAVVIGFQHQVWARSREAAAQFVVWRTRVYQPELLCVAVFVVLAQEYGTRQVAALRHRDVQPSAQAADEKPPRVGCGPVRVVRPGIHDEGAGIIDRVVCRFQRIARHFH